MGLFWAFLLLGCVAHAMRLPSLPARSGPSFVASKRIDGRAISVTAQDLDNFKLFAQYAGAAYCNEDALPNAVVACTENVCPIPTANSAKIVISLNGFTSTNIDGYVAVDPQRKLIVVSFRGSSSVRNWIANALFIFVPCSAVEFCAVHAGFQEAWNQVKSDVLAAVKGAREANPDYTVVSTGHSLGGAVATLAGLDLRIQGIPTDIYTYGSPRVGNAQIADFITAQPGGEYRITHLDDPVTRLPPLFLGYRHTSPEYWLSTGTSETTDYRVSDIKICEGNDNLKCSGAGLDLDVNAHLYYFEHISACGPGKIGLRDLSGTNDTASDDSFHITDAELTQLVNDWAQQDRDYLAALELEANLTAST